MNRDSEPRGRDERDKREATESRRMSRRDERPGEEVARRARAQKLKPVEASRLEGVVSLSRNAGRRAAPDCGYRALVAPTTATSPRLWPRPRLGSYEATTPSFSARARRAPWRRAMRLRSLATRSPRGQSCGTGAFAPKMLRLDERRQRHSIHRFVGRRRRRRTCAGNVSATGYTPL